MTKQYKVLTTKNKMFGGKFDPEKIEKVLNEWAGHGCSVISITAADRAGNFAGGGMQELVIVMEWGS